MILIALLGGYLIGSIPSAEWLGQLWGVDLRRDGSQNPGANNARRLGGMTLAAIVLAVEIIKGVGAVLIGFALAGDPGAAFAAVGAVTGNVYNVWYRFRGGKGLAISGGVLLALWPTVLVPVLAVLGASVLITWSSGRATLITVGLLIAMAVPWMSQGWPMAWGIEAGPLLLLVSIGLGVVLWQKHSQDSLSGPVPD